MNPTLILEYRRRYWTLVVNGKALMTFESLAKATAFAPEAGIVYPKISSHKPKRSSLALCVQ